MTVEVPWNAWFEDGEMALSFPDPWRVDVLRMTAPPAPPATVAERIATPLDSEPLRTLARGKRLVGIAVDDIARPTPVHEFLPQVVDELLAAGVPEDGIQVFVASGAHRTPVLGDVVRKIGAPLAERLKIVYHNPYDNLADLGHTSSGVPIAINRSYLACDLRISIGGITPHDFAGFGGGYKTVTVGLSGIRALHETHIKRIARVRCRRGPHRRQSLSGVRAGDRREGRHRLRDQRGDDRAARDRGPVCRRPGCRVPQRVRLGARALCHADNAGGYDVAVLNAYPKDVDCGAVDDGA